MSRRGISIVALVAAVAAGLSFSGGAAVTTPPQFVPRETYDAPGRLVRLPDHRKLNFLCMGKGSPTVILESGFGAGAFAWGRVQPRIAAVTRVCAYDRAGYGFSDPGPLPRDGQAIARDLERGLAAADINGPYVLVGHSAGGLYARLFAARHRREVKGMLFVDSSVEHQPQRIAQLFGTTAATLDGQRRRPVRCQEIAEGKGVAATDVERQGCTAAAGPGPAGLGQRAATWQSQLSELDALFEQTSDQVDRTRGLLKDIPAIVLTASSTDGPPGVATDAGAAAWQAMHHELAGQFLDGQQRLVKSGHLMMNERPEVVTAAALELVEQARKKR